MLRKCLVLLREPLPGGSPHLALLSQNLVVYNLTYFLDQKMKCLVTQKFDLDPINIDLRYGKMSKILKLEWWPSQFLGLKILTLIPLNQYIFNVFLTKFGVLLCLNGGSNGPEINFPGHVMGGLQAGGL